MNESHATVCRGCCCGTSDPVQAKVRLELLRALVNRVRVSDCLGPCARKDVVVVSPSKEARKQGAGNVWLGWINDDNAMREVGEWIQQGGPGCAPMPINLALHRFAPDKRSKAS